MGSPKARDMHFDRVMRNLFAMKCPKVMITAVMLIFWLRAPAFGPFERWDVVDLFAGQARIARLARQYGQSSIAMDIGYHEDPHIFDINSEPGFVMALKSILEGRYGSLLVTLGVCCSSWITTSNGSTKRSFLTPMGCCLYATVAAANKMVSRCVLLLLAVISMNGIYILEQPSSSLIMMHERMVWLQHLLESLLMRMFLQRFWMKGLGHQTPKRTVLFSNTAWLVEFSFASKLKKQQLTSEVKTTDQYTSKSGRKRFKGNGNLKATQVYTWPYARRILQIKDLGKREIRDPIPGVDETSDLKKMYAALPWDDLWGDADMWGDDVPQRFQAAGNPRRVATLAAQRTLG